MNGMKLEVSVYYRTKFIGLPMADSPYVEVDLIFVEVCMEEFVEQMKEEQKFVKFAESAFEHMAYPRSMAPGDLVQIVVGEVDFWYFCEYEGWSTYNPENMVMA
jgi:hypothetical protein